MEVRITSDRKLVYFTYLGDVSYNLLILGVIVIIH